MKVILDNIENIPAYGILGTAGVICGIVYLWVITRKTGIDFSDVIYVYVWSAIGAMVGAKLLYIFIEMPQITGVLRQYIAFGSIGDGSITIKDYAVGLLSGGFVFYGGVFGGLLSLVLVCRYFRYDCDSMFMVITPALPLAHAFGRVGCTVAGCCYGIETDGIISIVYHNSRYAPVGVRLFPVQLVEAAGDIVIFIILVYIILRNLNIKNVAFGYKKSGSHVGFSGHEVLYIYLLMYAVLRFVLEFLRGDAVRGHWLFFSTSQWICILVLMYVIPVLLKSRKAGKAVSC